MRPAPATHGRHTPPQPPMKGEGDRGAVEGFNKQERWRGSPEKHTPPQPPLKGEGDHEVVEGFNKQERRLLLRKSNSYNDG